jgi:DNA polymerase-1
MLLAQAARLGVSFSISGTEVVMERGQATPPLPADLLAALRQHRDAIRALLDDDGNADRAAIRLLSRLGIEAVVPQTVAEALALLAEIEADAAAMHAALPKGRRPRLPWLGLDIETQANPGEPPHPNIRLRRDGRPTIQQPKLNDAPLDIRRASVRLIQLYGGGKRCLVLDTRLVPLALLTDVLTRNLLVIHNAKFELAFFHAAGITLPYYECTMQAAGLLQGVRRRGLDDAASAYLGVSLGKELQTSDWSANVLSKGQIAYAAVDAVIALRLWPKLRAELIAKQRGPAYKLQRDVTRVTMLMEARGIRVDPAALRSHIADWQNARAAASHLLAGMTGRPEPGSKVREMQDLLRSILPIHMIYDWPRTKTGHLSTRRSVLLHHSKQYPAIQHLIDIAAYEKLLDAFGDRLVAKVTKDCRVHASFSVASTKAGRFSSSGPNMQQIPGRRSKSFRESFLAAPDSVLIVGDYSTMELRAAAEVSDDAAMRAVFAMGRDLHREQAAAMVGIALDVVAPEQRNAAKAINFGIIYGAGSKGLAASAWDSYNIVISEAEAQHALDTFMQRFPTYAAWRNTHVAECERLKAIPIGTLGRVIEAAWEAPAIIPRRSFWSRRCDTDGEDDGDDADDPYDENTVTFAPKRARAFRYTLCLNAPIQGACADVIILAMLKVDRALVAAGIDGAHGLVLSVHDELVLDVPADRAGECSRILHDCMVAAFVEVFPNAPTSGLVEVRSGPTWGAAKG